MLYLAVFSGLLLRLLSGLLLSWRIVRGATPICEDWAGGFDVRASPRIDAPATFGSVILLPGDHAAWTPARRLAVLAHEGAHVARRDFAIQLAAGVNRAVFWFNPFSWWLQRRLSDLAEAASDDAAIACLDDRFGYAEILLEIAGRVTQIAWRHRDGAPRGRRLAHRAHPVGNAAAAGHEPARPRDAGRRHRSDRGFAVLADHSAGAVSPETGVGGGTVRNQDCGRPGCGGGCDTAGAARAREHRGGGWTPPSASREAIVAPTEPAVPSLAHRQPEAVASLSPPPLRSQAAARGAPQRVGHTRSTRQPNRNQGGSVIRRDPRRLVR